MTSTLCQHAPQYMLNGALIQSYNNLLSNDSYDTLGYHFGRCQWTQHLGSLDGRVLENVIVHGEDRWWCRKLLE